MHKRIADAWVEVALEVTEELEHQYQKWGDQYHNIHVHNSISGEEYGEMVQAINDADFYDATKPDASDPIYVVGDLKVYNAADYKQHEHLWQAVMDETVDTIACLVQLWVEARRRRDKDTSGTYSAVNSSVT